MFQVLVKGRCGEPAHFSENYGSSNNNIRVNRGRCGHHSDISGNKKQLMKSAHEILTRHIDKETMDSLSENIWPDMLDAMHEYAVDYWKFKNDIHDVKNKHGLAKLHMNKYGNLDILLNGITLPGVQNIIAEQGIHNVSNGIVKVDLKMIAYIDKKEV